MTRPLLLASTSPQRRAILTQLRIPFEVAAPLYEEEPLDGLDPAAVVRAHARGKAHSVAGDGPVLGVDTEVVCEGRVSGDAGLYWPDGSIRDELVEALVAACGVERLIFEAPRRSQQAWLVRHFGSDVNLGNVLPWDLIAVESLRLGLRSDTLTRFHA